MKLNNTMLIFLLGFFADISVITIFDNTIFLYLMYGIAAISVLYIKKISIQKTPFLPYIILVIFSTILCLSNSIFSSAWQIKSIITCINMCICFVCCNFILCNEKYIVAYLRGVYTGCIMQIIWCYMQIILYNIFSIDLNGLCFGVFSQHRGGGLVYSGLAIHAGILVPIFIIGFLTADKLVLKILFVVMGAVSGNSTTMIGIGICIVSYGILLLVFHWRSFIKKINIFRILIVVPVLILIGIIWSKFGLGERFTHSFNRIISVIINQQTTNGSDATHLRYLTSFPYILKNSSIINILFGYGVGTSGFQMVRFFGQYDRMIWTIESDIINTIYSVGLIGFGVFYYLLLYIMIKGFKIDIRYTVFSLAIIGAGIFYNFQISWLIILEVVMYCCIKKKINCWEIFNMAV